MRAALSVVLFAYLLVTQLFAWSAAPAPAQAATVRTSAHSNAASAISLALGANFTCAINASNGLQCWGSNQRYELTEAIVPVINTTPQDVSGILFNLNSNVTQVSAGEHHTCAIHNGALKCWGASFYGQIGNNPSVEAFGRTYTTSLEYHFARIDEISTTARAPETINMPNSQAPTSIALGDFHTCAVAGGAAYCWGRNHYGQLGIGNVTGQPSPTAVNGLSSGVVAMYAGDDHTCALNTSNALFCWGGNTYGQLGDGSTTHKLSPPASANFSGVSTAALGGQHTCVIKSGAVECAGNNAYGQLGNGTTTDASTPVQAIASGATSVAAGDFHTCAVVSGAVRCWGRNNHGQLGTNTLNDSPTPVQVIASGASQVFAGDLHTCALMTNGEVLCWGRNHRGQLGDGTLINKYSPTGVTGYSAAPGTLPPPFIATATPIPPGALAIAAGSRHTCALTNGSIKCWGANALGQLGNNSAVTSFVPVDVSGYAVSPPPTDPAVSISAGTSTSCLVAQSGEVKCWGDGRADVIADGAGVEPRRVPSKILDISSADRAVRPAVGGAFHTCAQMADGGVRCWGQQVAGGSIGDGSGAVRQRPAPVTGISNALPPPAKSQTSAGQEHACVIVERGRVKCWGGNAFGQIGDGTFSNQRTETSPPGFVETFNNRYIPVYVRQVENAIEVEMGLFHSCALINTGRVKCWGYNIAGQLGRGTATQREVEAAEVLNLEHVTSIAAGNNHTCAIVSPPGGPAGQVFCWGRGVVGQLGNGFSSFSAQPVPVLGIVGAEAIAATNDHTCIVTGSGNAFCWGANSAGQLGANPAQYPNSSIAIDVTAARPINATPGTPQPYLTLVGGVRPVLLPMVRR